MIPIITAQKRLSVDWQDPLPEYPSVYKEQHTEKAPCHPFRADERNTVHIPAAKKAAQDAQIQRIEQQKSNRYVVKHCTKQFALGVADVLCKYRQQVSRTESRQRPHKAEDAELYACHSVGTNIDLNAKPHKFDLLKYAGKQGI